MVTVSPPVSPSVVAAILMIQNTRVTCGTLESAMLPAPAGSSICKGHLLAGQRDERRIVRSANIAPLCRHAAIRNDGVHADRLIAPRGVPDARRGARC